MSSEIINWDELSMLKGEFFLDDLHKSIYATDASVYRKTPLAVVYPKNGNDIQKLITFATKYKTTLIPRTAGTSLAGQCVGDGIVVDISKHFTKILDFDKANKTIKVEPGVIRDELNLFLKPHGLFFGPNTSTSNRCMIGGMVGNNSSGSTSIQYGVTRDKVLCIDTILSNTSLCTFSELTSDKFKQKSREDSLEGKIYRSIFDKLSNIDNQKEIINEFPKETIHRRNTGYAIDALLKSNLFGGTSPTINIAKLLCGSEGTLAFSTTITLQLDDLPPTESVMVTSHFTNLNESLKATVIAMKHNLFNCELMDKTILDCTKNNREQTKNRFFIKNDPEIILMLEVRADTKEETEILANNLITDLKNNNYGFHHPKVYGNDIEKVHNLRKAGLGLLGNIVGDNKAVACIEDTAVDLEDLPNYIDAFSEIMEKYQQKAVYYAHAGAGELHLRPILNLKKSADVTLFRKITTETAQLVKKYKGSFSGEHGDGIVRSEFIPIMIGEKNYQILRQIKNVFDPNNVFNKGKIIDAFPMDQSLRYRPERNEPKIKTIQDFSDSEGILKLAEKCNGSGDCRKPVSAGGTMCPSYRATKNEKDTTRARANALREFLTSSEKPNKFNHKELHTVFDLCLSCKACASECPSNVDVASLKAEFLHQYYKEKGVPLRTKMFAYNAKLNKIGSLSPRLTNFILNTKAIKKITGVATKRKIPLLAKTTVFNWYSKNKKRLLNHTNNFGELYLFIDEYTNYYDASIGVDAIELLTKLGYKVNITKHEESGRSFISKGLLNKAKEIANFNVNFFKEIITKDTPLVGIEPSAILTFRDEYLRLTDDKTAAKKLAKNVFTMEEFIRLEFQKNNITSNSFNEQEKTLKIHGHCHQKSLSNIESTFKMVSIPKNYHVTIINSGCCGMAGSFGYEKEHYDISMEIGENTLFPKIRRMKKDTIIVASGTSCRHQIKDGTNRSSKHPITILKEALI